MEGENTALGLALYISIAIIWWTILSSYMKVIKEKHRKSYWKGDEVYIFPGLISVVWPLTLPALLAWFFVRKVSDIIANKVLEK